MELITNYCLRPARRAFAHSASFMRTFHEFRLHSLAADIAIPRYLKAMRFSAAFHRDAKRH
jgi:hypothetical protein